MNHEFQWEARYAVFKFSKLNGPQSKILQDTMCKLPRIAECLVIESDWPEYEPVWAMIEARMTGAATVPPDGGEVEVLGWLTAGKLMPTEQDSKEYASYKEHGDVTELVDRAHVTRLQAENAALQQRLNVADQRVDDATDLLQRAQQLIPALQYNWHANTKALLDAMQTKQ